MAIKTEHNGPKKGKVLIGAARGGQRRQVISYGGGHVGARNCAEEIKKEKKKLIFPASFSILCVICKMF